jgi:hypothetical protein
MKLLRALVDQHEKFCPLGGYKGMCIRCHKLPCDCLHRGNCVCKAGERVTIAYAKAMIRSLKAEIAWWQARIKST